MTGRDVLTGRASLPAGMLAELAALRAALPGYDVILTSHSPACRYEATRRDPGPGIWCVVSTDPADLWRELAPRARPGAPGRPPLLTASHGGRASLAKARPAPASSPQLMKR